MLVPVLVPARALRVLQGEEAPAAGPPEPTKSAEVPWARC